MPIFGIANWPDTSRTHSTCTERGAHIVGQDLGPFSRRCKPAHEKWSLYFLDSGTSYLIFIWAQIGAQKLGAGTVSQAFCPILGLESGSAVSNKIGVSFQT